MRFLVLVSVLLFPRIVNATPLEDFTDNMGYLIASEKLCGLAYDKQAITEIIAINVPDDNITFAQQLMFASYMATNYIKAQIKNPSYLTAHCAYIRRIAKYYKFIK